MTASDLLTTKEVARLMRVNPGTVNRWARDGLLPSIRVTPTADRRYRREDVLALIDDTVESAPSRSTGDAPAVVAATS